MQQGKSFGKPAGGKLEYGAGDRVRHIKFGEGTVLSIVEGGRDYEVTVNFDGPGTKKMSQHSQNYRRYKKYAEAENFEKVILH